MGSSIQTLCGFKIPINTIDTQKTLNFISLSSLSDLYVLKFYINKYNKLS